MAVIGSWQDRLRLRKEKADLCAGRAGDGKGTGGDDGGEERSESVSRSALSENTCASFSGGLEGIVEEDDSTSRASVSVGGVVLLIGTGFKNRVMTAPELSIHIRLRGRSVSYSSEAM